MTSENMGSGYPKQSNKLAVLGTIGFFALIILITFLANKVDTVANQKTPGHEIRLSEAQTVYVPAYSYIYSSGGQRALLETTLSIRNTDPDDAIRIKGVDYYDTNGELVSRQLSEPAQLKPMGTMEFLVKQQDISGGLGANFVITWAADDAVYTPIIEAVMIGDDGISFISKGRPLAKREEGAN
jgi:hypothetical protein